MTTTPKPPARLVPEIALVRKALAIKLGVPVRDIDLICGRWSIQYAGAWRDVPAKRIKEAEAKALQREGGGSTMAGSKSGAKPLGRKRNEPSPDTYSGRVAIRLRQLRQKRGWTVQELSQQLADRGQAVPVSSLYAYECGRKAGGVDLPTDLYPAVADALGVNVRTLLPAS